MASPGKPKRRTPLSDEEKLGRIWGWIFVGIVIVLTVVLVGKAWLDPM